MAVISITTNASQDAAIQRRRAEHNLATGQALTAVQFATLHGEALYNGWVRDDSRTAHVNIRDRWDRSTQAQRDAAASALAP